MSDYYIPAQSNDGANIAGSLNSAGIPFTLSPASGGYTASVPNDYNAQMESAFPQASQNHDDYGTLAGVFGNADTSNEGAGSGVSNNNGDKVATSGAVSDFFSKFGADAAAVIVGLILVAASVVKLV